MSIYMIYQNHGAKILFFDLLLEKIIQSGQGICPQRVMPVLILKPSKRFGYKVASVFERTQVEKRFQNLPHAVFQCLQRIIRLNKNAKICQRAFKKV